jgi:hypothetical protein
MVTRPTTIVTPAPPKLFPTKFDTIKEIQLNRSLPNLAWLYFYYTITLITYTDQQSGSKIITNEEL